MSIKIARGQIVSRYGYQGDPGLGGFLKKAAGLAMNFLPGGGIVKTVGGIILGGIAGNAAGKISAQQPIMLPSRPGIGAAPPLQVGPVGINLPYAGPPGVGITVAGQHLGITPANGNGAIPAGYRPNKSSYFLRDGTFVEKGSRYVKARRRNPLNPRAADRAISRLESAKKATQRLSRISIRKKKCCG